MKMQEKTRLCRFSVLVIIAFGLFALSSLTSGPLHAHIAEPVILNTSAGQWSSVKGYEVEALEWRDLVNWHETMHNARPAWIRFAVRWDMIELTPGVYSWYNTSTPTPSVYPSTTPLSYAYDFYKKYEIIQTQYPEAKMFVTVKIAPPA